MDIEGSEFDVVWKTTVITFFYLLLILCFLIGSVVGRKVSSISSWSADDRAAPHHKRNDVGNLSIVPKDGTQTLFL